MPNWNGIVREHLAVLRLPPEREIEIIEELALHLESAYEDALAAGFSEAEAEARAVQSYDWRLLECELNRAERLVAARALQPSLESIEQKGGMRMGSLLQDLRFGARMLLKNPGFTLVAALTLALGIGANTMIFSVFNSVLLRTLPFNDPGRILSVWATDTRRGEDRRVVSYPNFDDWRAQQTAFERFAGFESVRATLTGVGTPEQLRGLSASADLFPLLGVQPLLGRWFTEQEALTNYGTVVIISESLWRRRFGGDAKIIGSAITLDGKSLIVAGVMPASFRFPLAESRPAEFWGLLQPDRQRGNNHLNVIARLKPGTTMMQAQAEMNTVAARLTAQYPNSNTGRGIRLTGMQEDLTRNARRPLFFLLACVGCVLLIACANVANLLLARVTGRRKEIAVRSALGATRGRVIRQLLVESALLAITGGAAGVLVSILGISALRPLIPRIAPIIQEISLDWRVLAFSISLSLLTGILFGLAPAAQTAKVNLTNALKEEGRGLTGGLRQNRTRAVLVIVEVALSLTLLIGAGLLLRSFLRLLNVNPGFNPEGVITFDFSLPESRYGKRKNSEFYQQLIERVAAIPGVQTASVGDPIPLGGGSSTAGVIIEGQPPMLPTERPKPQLRFVSRNYLRAMGTPLLKGRTLDDGDRFDAPNVMLVNETFARRFFPNQDPLGKRVSVGIRVGIGDNYDCHIVGVVADVKRGSLHEDAEPECYLSYLQNPFSEMTLIARVTGDPAGIVPVVRGEVERMDRELAISDIRTMRHLLDEAVAPQRFILFMLGLFAGLALVLATVGIYSVMAYAVTQRTNEIGVRLALGASAGAVVKLVVGQGMALALAGIGIGLITSLALTRVMKTLLFGVGATDTLTYAAVTLLLTLAALLACYIPARRATKIDPLTALRHE
jgi:putative ABC transport system permease protein